jgi:hypothetical protein
MPVHHQGLVRRDDNMNRKQRRAFGKQVGEKASSAVDLILSIPDKCSVCQKDFDKKSKEMAKTWFVDVFSEQKLVVLTCPECRKQDGKAD